MNRIDILAPELPESIMDATVISWRKKIGDIVARDEVLVEIETDKVILEVSAIDDGVLDEVLKDEGTSVSSREILGHLRRNNSSEKATTSFQHSEKASTVLSRVQQVSKNTQSNDTLTPKICSLRAKHSTEPSEDEVGINSFFLKKKSTKNQKKLASDMQENKGKEELVNQPSTKRRMEKRVPMTRFRLCVAERLLQVKNSTAMLTTFNEVNMKKIIECRKQYGKVFEELHGIRLGSMAFYVKAIVEGLKRYPEINAFIDGDDIVYHEYFDVSIAISTPRGLVTPVLRDVDCLSMVDIEKKIQELALKGEEGKLTVQDLTGGNFTITNGGVFGSLLSTPIINPPQSAILGVHAIQERPMAVDGKIKILPMMYLALSYDHRLIDGRESIGFLLMIRELLENPMRLLLEV